MTIRRRLFLLVILAFPFVSRAAEETLADLEPYDSMTVSGGFDLTVRQGSPATVVISTMLGSPNDILVDVSNGRLTVSKKSSLPFFLQWFTRYQVTVTLPTLASLHASSGSDVASEGEFTADIVRLAASGGSDLRANISADEITLEASGGSYVELRGSARRLVAELSGGSELQALRYVVQDAEIEAGGRSDGEVNVTGRLQVRASGGSVIRYDGDPSETDVDARDASDVSPL